MPASNSQPCSQVAVSVETKDGAVIVRVWNSSSSITSGERGRIFDRFYRGTQVRSGTPGSGLGLYVARKIAILHGGNLDLESLEAGIGVAFRFSIACPEKESKHDSQIQCASRG
jgi:signal transduction histidine kinase